MKLKRGHFFAIQQAVYNSIDNFEFNGQFRIKHLSLNILAPVQNDSNCAFNFAVSNSGMSRTKFQMYGNCQTNHLRQLFSFRNEKLFGSQCHHVQQGKLSHLLQQQFLFKEWF